MSWLISTPAKASWSCYLPRLSVTAPYRPTQVSPSGMPNYSSCHGLTWPGLKFSSCHSEFISGLKVSHTTCVSHPLFGSCSLRVPSSTESTVTTATIMRLSVVASWSGHRTATDQIYDFRPSTVTSPDWPVRHSFWWWLGYRDDWMRPLR
jgi:hypothetical protein